MELCGICGDDLNNEFVHTIPLCNHSFHYSCLLDSLKMNRNCPYCRGKVNLLPPINGLKKLIPGIHYFEDNSYNVSSKGDYIHSNIGCNYKFKKGKNKGEQCLKNCKLGYHQCKLHLNKI
ncbi:MAG: hypothetical protein CMG46_02030 [Candidatus Marinimicrobia bacterium]|nr:hypothetical protein [Candidatus Neomarinimicrobiota bacterium]|tara:strand:+ start:578 stop:937 length:360 start_codon:yes stop_codon:yes gene_type:complete